jgi:hypothetical protein
MDSRYFREHASTYWGIDFFPRKTITARMQDSYMCNVVSG